MEQATCETTLTDLDLLANDAFFDSVQKLLKDNYLYLEP